MIEWLHFHFSLSCIGEGNGNPLQCCLENPRTGGAWCAAVYRVTHSRTRLKRFSNSSSSMCECDYPQRGKHGFNRCNSEEDGRKYSLQESAAAAESLQSCPTLCEPIDGSPPGSHVPGILQARILEWVAISFSNAWKCKVKGKSLSCVRLFATPWTAAHQASPSIGFARQEYWSGVP